ncbi:MAG: 16S rRNA (cytidine(1402)-2'-O)-methyltransferase [Magnetospiraceae bacterium]
MTAYPNAEGPESKPVAPGLYLVATPIGNARDLGLRALDVLRAAQVIACEDSRVSGKLLSLYGIKSTLIPYHDHNAARVRPKLLERLARGEIVALISDAGTPLISDPGQKLVRDCRAAGLPVTTVPGASSVLAALTLSGLPADRFMFAGFLPPKTVARKATLADLAPIPATLVILESPKRLAASLADMAEMLGDREACVARELTKMFEELRNGSLPELADHYAEHGPPKGEVVVVVAPPDAKPALDPAALADRLRAVLAENSLRDAVAQVVAETGLPRKQVYAQALAVVKDAD